MTIDHEELRQRLERTSKAMRESTARFCEVAEKIQGVLLKDEGGEP